MHLQWKLFLDSVEKLAFDVIEEDDDGNESKLFISITYRYNCLRYEFWLVIEGILLLMTHMDFYKNKNI